MKGNKSSNNLISYLILILLVALPISGFSDVPRTISYQGYLTDAGGTTIDGTRQMTFRIYDVSTGGTERWTETHGSVTVNLGVYSVVLGSIDSVGNPLNLPFDEQYWLGIEVGTDSEMIPRQPLTSVPYAFRADVADNANNVVDNAVTNMALSDGAVTDEKISGIISGAKIGSHNHSSLVVGGSLRIDDNTETSSLFLRTDGLGVDLDAVGKPLYINYGGQETYFMGGYVGIGTSTPGNKLDVSGDINTSGVYKMGGMTLLSAELTNIFLGYGAGYSNTSGLANIFIGDYAGYGNDTGNSNTFIGNDAGRSNTEGYQNTFLGNYAGFSNSTGNYNTFLGRSAGRANDTGNSNTFLGTSAGFTNSTGYENTFIGYNAGYYNTEGYYNTFLAHLPQFKT